MQAAAQANCSTWKELQARLRSKVGKTIQDYSMIEATDRIMVCLSSHLADSQLFDFANLAPESRS